MIYEKNMKYEETTSNSNDMHILMEHNIFINHLGTCFQNNHFLLIR